MHLTTIGNIFSYSKHCRLTGSSYIFRTRDRIHGEQTETEILLMEWAQQSIQSWSKDGSIRFPGAIEIQFGLEV